MAVDPTTSERDTAPASEGELSGAARRQMNRKLRREQRQLEQQARARRLLVRRVAVWLGGMVLVAAALYVALPPILASYNRPAASAASSQTGWPGQQFPDQGRTHIKRGETHPPYNSTPPTSGWHWEDWPQYGIYTEQLPDEWQIHHLEHGGIMIQYSCPSGCPEVVDQLTNIARRYRYKVILAPYTGLPNRITLTAWTRLDAMDEVDEARIVDFIDAYRNKGPEAYPDLDADVKR